jgi:archaellum component FlaC
MEKLSMKKQLTLVRLYLNGLSYSQIVAKTGVSKGSVANVIAALKAGQFPEAQLPAEQIELLHELATELDHLRQTPAQAIVGLAALSSLHELGVEPSDVQEWAAVCKHLAADKTEAPSFVKAALYLEELLKSTGLSYQALAQKAQSLHHEVKQLEPIAQELKKCPGQLANLNKTKQGLTEEISHLENRYQPLSNDIALKEKREAELSYRVQELEQRAQAADERLAAAREALKTLAKLGLSPEDFPGFIQRIAAVAHKQGMQPVDLRDRLLHELEQLKKGLGLESLVQTKQKELASIKKDIAKASEKQAALESAISELNRQKASLEATIAEEQGHVIKVTHAMNQSVQEAAAKLKQDLQKSSDEAVLEVQNIKNQALEVGQELGHFSGIVEADGWLKTLASLIKGDASASAAEVRTVALAVVLGLRSYMQHQGTPSYLLTTYLNNVIQELEQWKV